VHEPYRALRVEAAGCAQRSRERGELAVQAAAEQQEREQRKRSRADEDEAPAAPFERGEERREGERDRAQAERGEDGGRDGRRIPAAGGGRLTRAQWSSPVAVGGKGWTLMLRQGVPATRLRSVGSTRGAAKYQTSG
jgi:hypothetical protein